MFGVTSGSLELAPKLVPSVDIVVNTAAEAITFGTVATQVWVVIRDQSGRCRQCRHGLLGGFVHGRRREFPGSSG